MWTRNLMTGAVAAAVLLGGVMASVALGQSPIQWNGNTQTAIARAQEQQLPLMFWVTERADLLDDDDLRNEQNKAFRDPMVVSIAQARYVPVRVSRNSRVLAEAEKFGLPTTFGLYIALITPDGKLMAEIDPASVANPEALADRLTAAFRAYRDQLYTEKLKPVITNKEAAKQDVRAAVQTVWRLEILSADADIVALLGRADVTPSDRGRLYTMLASFATQPCVEALLAGSVKGDKDAERALGRAQAGALEWLLPRLPTQDGEVSAEQMAAYRAAVQVARAGSAKPETFWKTAKAEERGKELEFVKRKAEPVLEYWKETVGRWR